MLLSGAGYTFQDPACPHYYHFHSQWLHLCHASGASTGDPLTHVPVQPSDAQRSQCVSSYSRFTGLIYTIATLLPLWAV